MFSSTFALVPLLLASYVSAHGFLAEVTIGGRSDTGNRPFGSGGSNSAIRQITSPNPNTGANNPALTCGPGARRAAEVLNVNPGDNMSFDWRGADLSFWPHNTGPMITYLANCGDTPCNQFDTSNARWFKIHQVGKKANSNNWVQGDLMNGARANAKLPNNLAPGNYIVRHEIIALHLASNPRGAEYYPACVQIRVGGNGNGRPTQDELVSFPGGYSDTHPGIRVNAFSNAAYNFPGPRIANFVTNPGAAPAPPAPSPTNGNGNGNGNSPRPSSSTRGAQTPSSKPASSTKAGNNTKPTPNPNNGSQTAPKPKVCKLRKGASSAKVARSTSEPAPANYPRHFSRVMRRIAENSGFEARAASPAPASR
jgi:hypothetical protein